jgi:hypothetical protein
MKLQILILFLVCFISTAFVTKDKAFPEINYQTTTGENFTNKDLIGKNTVVVHLHIGCPGAMMLLKDLQIGNWGKSDLDNLVFIFENSQEQLNAFNDSTNNAWSSTRKYFKIKPLEFILLAECENPTGIEKTESGGFNIGKQCDLLSKELKIKVSPIFFYLNNKAEIIKTKKGYNPSKTLKQLSEHIK